MTDYDGDWPVMIGVTGTHSTGKTTFLARLAHELRRDGIAVATVADLGEAAQRIGLPILHNHTFASTCWIITRGIAAELEAALHADVVLVDRAVPDALAYYRAALAYRQARPDPADVRYLEQLVAGHSTRYDLIFRTTVDHAIPLGEGKPRDTDRLFRDLCDRHVGTVLADLNLPYVPLPAHSHDDALRQAMEFVVRRITAPTDPPNNNDDATPQRGAGRRAAMT